MKNFGLVVIGAHTGIWLQDLFDQYKDQNILLIEPVPHNLNELTKNILNYKNITIEPIAISDKNENKKFYFVKAKSVEKLKKHWASGIGSFNKEHILNHKTKRFKVTDNDIENIDIKCLTINDLIKKYSISSIQTLQIDVEGSEFEILNNLDFQKVDIKRIFFESKHFDGTFKEGKKLEFIKEKLTKEGYKIIQVDKENIRAEKD